MGKYEGTLSRKEMRKEGKKIKKQKKAEFFSRGKINNNTRCEGSQYINNNINKNNSKNKNKKVTQNQYQQEQPQYMDEQYYNQNEQQYNEQDQMMLDNNDEYCQQNQNNDYDNGGDQYFDDNNEDDELIRFYEEKLKKNGSKKKKEDKIMLKENGLDDDFFDFLDDISHKVKGKKGNKQMEVEERKQKKVKRLKKVQEKIMQQQQIVPQQINLKTVSVKQQKAQQITMSLEQQQQQQTLRKGLNSLLNKVSDGNILKISRQINTIFINNAKSKVFPCFSELFIKSTAQNPKILNHILAANVTLACGLHHLYDNQFFAQIIAKLVDRFDELQKTTQVIEKNEDDVEMNPVLEKKKNCLKNFCYMYMLGSITIDFMKQFFFELTANISHSNIELLYLLVTTIGSKIRSDDPKILKDIIEYIQQQIGESKNQGYQENNKIKFVLHELNELKLNKKCLIDPDQRFNFLVTFLKKNILQENGLSPKIYVLTLTETRNADKSSGFWWEFNTVNRDYDEQEQGDEKKDQVVTEESRYLEDLARQQKMVTQKKKKIFFSIMKSQDYLEAVQNILLLKIKNPNQVAEVIVQICSQQKTFNLFYVYLANKLIQCSIRYKNAFKFAIWNQQSQFQNYTLRKITNIAKFTARLIILSTQSSLAFLKNLGDLMSLDKFYQIFLLVTLQQFFQNVQMDRLGALMTKIRVGDNNKQFKQNLQQYLQQDYYKYCQQNKKAYKDKVKVSVRLLRIQDDDREEKQDRQ